METLSAATLPYTEISNAEVTVKIYLPDAKDGFYRGTRFDWSGVIYSLQAHGHEYYGPSFDKTDPEVHNFTYRDSDIVAGPCSAASGPVNEFDALGWENAKPGEHFVKVGVGALRRPDERPMIITGCTKLWMAASGRFSKPVALSSSLKS